MFYKNCSLKVRIYLEGKFFEIKAENVDIALVTASLPDCAKQTGLSNEDIGKFFSKITAIIEYYLYYIIALACTTKGLANYMEEKFIEIKAKNVNIALVTVKLFNADIDKFFS